VKGVYGEKLKTPDLSQQLVLGIKEIPRTGSCELVESHHCFAFLYQEQYISDSTVQNIWV